MPLPIIPTAKIVNELFRFVTVRNPDTVHYGTMTPLPEGATYPGPSTGEVDTAYPTSLMALKASGKPGPEVRQDLLDAANDFSTKDDFFKNVEDWQTYFPNLKPFLEEIAAEKQLTGASFHAAAQRYFGASDALAGTSQAAKDILTAAWNNLITYNIIGGEKKAINYALRTIQVNHLLKSLPADNIPIDQQGLYPTVYIPDSIFPIPKPEKSLEEPDGTAYDMTEEDIQKVNESLAAIVSIQKAKEEIQKIYDYELEEERTAIALRPGMNYDNEGNIIWPDEDGQRKEPIGLLDRDFRTRLSSATIDLLEEQDISEVMSAPFAIQYLSDVQQNFSRAVTQKLKLQKHTYRIGDALFESDFNVQSRPPLPPSGPIYDPPAPIDNRTPFNDGIDIKQSYGCRIKPLGIADYRRVEQKLICYKPGEIAHIENILKGEGKERITRRLTQTEETYATVTEREITEERDTITTDRYQLEKQTSKVTQEDQAMDIGVSVQGQYGVTKVEATANFSTAYSSATSDASAVSYAKDVTERALKRVIERTREERVLRMLEEFEETNKHTIDNVGGEGHVVGLYRWVDKIYEASVVNYGKRLMFEFTIPDPAAFHRFAMQRPDIQADIDAPLHPVNDITAIKAIIPELNSLSAANGINETNYQLWASFYGAQAEPPPSLYIVVGTAKSKTNMPNDGKRMENLVSTDLTMPSGYMANHAYLHYVMGYSPTDPWLYMIVGKGGVYRNSGNTADFPMYGETGTIPIAAAGRIESFALTVDIVGQRTPELYQDWQNKTYNAIMDAYNAKLAAYQNALAETQARMGIEIEGTNPGLNRIIEQTELKKHCIRLLTSCSFQPSEAMKDKYHAVDDSPDFDCCEAIGDGKFVQFVENCFDWRLMTYTFYPYFYSRRSKWKEIYRLSDPDPIFLGFLQAGYARVVVPVAPDFEEAALRFAADGTIWNGGDVPGINDPYYKSLINDLRVPSGTVEETWELRVPTTLTILQDDASGIPGSGLPCDPEGI